MFLFELELIGPTPQNKDLVVSANQYRTRLPKPDTQGIGKLKEPNDF